MITTYLLGSYLMSDGSTSPANPSVQPRSLNWMRPRRTHAPTALPDSGEFYLFVDFFYRQLNNKQLADYNFSCDQSWYIVMLGYRAEPLALLIVSNLYFSCSPRDVKICCCFHSRKRISSFQVYFVLDLFKVMVYLLTSLWFFSSQLLI